MPVSLSVLLSLPYIICCFCLAVIDILRMIVLHPDGASLLHKHMESGNGTVLCYCFSAFFFIKDQVYRCSELYAP
ncbi:hypothetical protein BHM03_00034353 [Ensete ventricosum]|nr:hypothetical protein BHM03_00034353 [Ensete ventricosum]